ncbi:VOC family protein [Ralstonia pickettii]|uniref:VOC family protein n=1 Tax=Ralstonia pickettii TaxID=329 RepID=UPI0004689BC0|nr:VOC family protein [Ralstonia pickettii]
MIDHTGVVVSDFEASKRFYERALGAIGLGKLREFPAAVTGHTDVAGFGPLGKAEFWISAATAGQGSNKPPVHVAFRVDTRADVDTFYAAALAAGGTDNGGPGVRAHYHPNYYGAFVRDPDGHNIEAVCHALG